MLAIEDLQWADDATVDLFCFLAHRMAGTPLVLVATFRPELDETGTTPLDSPHVRARDRLASHEDVQFLRLSRLSESELAIRCDQGPLAGTRKKRKGISPLDDILPLFVIASPGPEGTSGGMGWEQG